MALIIRISVLGVVQALNFYALSVGLNVMYLGVVHKELSCFLSYRNRSDQLNLEKRLREFKKDTNQVKSN